jgi:hypothetical protein
VNNNLPAPADHQTAVEETITIVVITTITNDEDPKVLEAINSLTLTLTQTLAKIAMNALKGVLKHNRPKASVPQEVVNADEDPIITVGETQTSKDNLRTILQLIKGSILSAYMKSISIFLISI